MTNTPQSMTNDAERDRISPFVTFKGTQAEYDKLHRWVSKNLGKPQQCWHCLDTSKGKYVWANKTGNYLYDLSDWERLCHRCHYPKGFGF